MKRVYWLGSALTLAMLPTCSMAADNQTTLYLSATGKAQATPTLLTANMTLQAEASDAAAAQAQVNAMSQRVTKEAAGSSVHLSVQDYSVAQSENKAGATHWLAQQTIVISGKEAEPLLKLTAKYQSEGAALSGLSWSLDDATHDALMRDARADALHHLQADAQQTAQVMGMHVQRYKTIRVETPYTPRPMMMARMAAAPQRTDDAQTVSVTISADVILTP